MCEYDIKTKPSDMARTALHTHFDYTAVVPQTITNIIAVGFLSPISLVEHNNQQAPGSVPAREQLKRDDQSDSPSNLAISNAFSKLVNAEVSSPVFTARTGNGSHQLAGVVTSFVAGVGFCCGCLFLVVCSGGERAEGGGGR